MESVPPLGLDAFAINVLSDDMGGTEETNGPPPSFRVQLIDKRTDGAEPVAQVLRKWDSFVQLDLFVRSIAPKFVFPPLPSPATATREVLRECMQGYLAATFASPSLTRLREVQDFVGYTTFALTDYNEHRRDGSAQLPPLLSKRAESSMTSVSAVFSSMSYPSVFPESNTNGGSEIGATEKHMLEECFRIMDVGAAGYITPDDMQEFFSAGVSSSPSSPAFPFSLSSPFAWLPSKVVERGRNEPCNLAQFIALVQAVLRSEECVRGIGEWIDCYWLMQYQKIFAASAEFVNLTSSEIPTEPLCGFDPQELAALLYVLTEAGLRLFSSSEVAEWFRERRHQRSCALSMQELSALLDALSSAVPFSETWVALLPRPPQPPHEPQSQPQQQPQSQQQPQQSPPQRPQQKQQRLIARYAALGPAAAADELRLRISQLPRATGAAAGAAGARGAQRGARARAARAARGARAARRGPPRAARAARGRAAPRGRARRRAAGGGGNRARGNGKGKGVGGAAAAVAGRRRGAARAQRNGGAHVRNSGSAGDPRGVDSRHIYLQRTQSRGAVGLP